MLLLVQSPFLQALGLAIANSLWQMGLIWLLYQLITSVAKPNASARYALASAAAFAGTIWFGLSCWYYWQTPAPFQSSLVLLTSQQQDGWLWRSVSAIRLMIPYLGVAYLLVVAVLAIRLYNSFVQVRTLRHTGLSKAPVDWRLFVKKYSALLHIEKPVTLLLSTEVSSPLTLGFWKPIILLPIASINQLSESQLEAVLLHELTHIRRHDYLINMWLQVAEMLLFFNPFMRSLLKNAYHERENSCDDWVLQFNYNPREYAAALLTIEQQAQKHVLALCATGSQQQQFHLLQRIRRMVAPEKNAFNYRSQMGMLAMLLVFGLLAHTIAGTRLAKTNTRAVVALKTPAPLVAKAGNEPFQLDATMALFAEIAQGIRAGNPTLSPATSIQKHAVAATQNDHAIASGEQQVENANALATIEHPLVITEMSPVGFVPSETVVANIPSSSLVIAQRKSEIAPTKENIQGMDEASLLTLSTLAEQLVVLEIEKYSLQAAVAKAEAEIRKIKVAPANAKLYEKDGTWYTQQLDEYNAATQLKKDALKEWQQHMEMAKQQLLALNDQAAALVEQQLNSQEASITRSLQDEIIVREKAIQSINREIQRLSKPLESLPTTSPRKAAKKPRVIIQL